MKSYWRCRRISGYSFLELLLTISLVSFALLGLLNVQKEILSAEGELLRRMQANLMFYDLLRWSDETNNAFATLESSDYGEPPEPTVDCLSSDCSPPERANFLLQNWKCRLGSWADSPACRDSRRPLVSLNSGDARIIANGQSLQVSIKWMGLGGEEQILRKDIVVKP